MDSLDRSLLQTPDLNKERLAKLKELYPDLFSSEGEFIFDEVKKIVDPESVKETERFEFKWYGKSEAKRTAFTPSRAALVYDEARSVNPMAANGNMIIEGENLEVLKCLLSAYREKIKCIYIDPPYNTGKDFVYSDKWDESKQNYWDHIGVTVDGIKTDSNTESSGRYHSNWLNMMHSRLLLARQLLKDDGAIFISIDNNETHNLRKLCDEIFGEDNFLGCIVRATGTTTGQDANKFGSSFDYCLSYRKTSTFILKGMQLVEKDLRRFSNDDNDGNGKYALLQLRKTGNADRKEDRESMFYPITAPDGKNIYPVGPGGYLSRWRMGKDKYNEYLDKGMIIWKKVEEVDNSQMIEDFEDELEEIIPEENGDKQNGNNLDIQINNTYVPYVKYYLKGRTKKPSTLWNDIDGNKKGSIELKELFNVPKIFDNPKPVDFISRIIEITCNNGDIVLDFFSGSGSTGHSVINFLEKGKINLKFILVQIPELTEEKTNAFKAGYKKISDITIVRIKRVIEKLHSDSIGLKVYKLAKSNFPRIDFTPDPDKTEAENIELLKKYIDDKERTFLSSVNENNLFDEVLLKNGFMLNYTLQQTEAFTKNKVFLAKDEFKECFICLDATMEEATVKEAVNFKDRMFICLERSLDTTKKWNLQHALGDKLIAF